MNTNIMLFSKQKIVLSLLLIGAISFILKLVIVDFEIPVHHDNFGFALRGIAYSSGDWGLNPKQHPGWPLFVSLFYHFINSNNFLDYSNALRIIAMTTSVITIVPMYLLARKFFNEKFSLVATSLFAFEPHLNYNAQLAYAEPLYILVIVITVLAILNKNFKFTLLSFALAGIIFWIRNEGFFMLIVLTVIYFIIFPKSRKLIPKFIFCILIFGLVISPLMIQKNYQYDDPFYFYLTDRFFQKDTETLYFDSNSTASNYLEEEGLESFFYRFVITGFYNIFQILPKILFPYLIIFVPFGIFFSFRAFDQKQKFIKANWAIIIITLLFFVTVMSVVQERRFLFILYPFLIIFATIPIQRVVEYGLSTFQFSNKQKNIFILFSLSLIIISSGIFSLRYIDDSELMHENIRLSNFFVNELDGDMMGGPELLFESYTRATNPPEAFKDYKINLSKHSYNNFPYVGINQIAVSGTTLDEVFWYGQKNNIKYLAVTNDNDKYFMLNDIYENENKYTYLEKRFDSTNHGFQKMKVKIFEINYELIP